MFFPLIRPKRAELTLHIFPDDNKTGTLKIFSEDCSLKNEIKVRGGGLLSFKLGSLWPDYDERLYRAVLGYVECDDVTTKIVITREDGTFHLSPFKEMPPNTYMFPSVHSDSVCILNRGDKPTKVTLDLKSRQIQLLAKTGVSILPCQFPDHPFVRFVFSGSVLVSELFLGYE